MKEICKLLIQCPVEILMSILFLGYLVKYGPFYEKHSRLAYIYEGQSNDDWVAGYYDGANYGI